MSEPSSPTWTASADRYVEHAAYVAALAGPLLELAGDVTGLRVLDLGCGDGRLTAALADAGADVLGIDADPSMVAATQDRGVTAITADARTLHGVEGPFDLVLSNAVLHWIPQASDVTAAVAGVLRPGGRFVLEAGGHGNVAAVRLALRAALDRYGLEGVEVPPWWFPTVAEQERVLEGAGFAVDHAVLVGRPTVLPGSIDEWLRTFAGDALGAAGADADAVVTETRRLLAPVLRDRDDTWTADYVRIRAAAHLPR